MVHAPPHLTADGLEYLERPGRGGPVLVLLHGIGSNAASFAPLLPLLPDDWRVIAWNAPGYGTSTPLEAGWPVAADYARALAGLYDALSLDRPLLVGHSLGALTAAAFAAEHPERVARLLLASPATGHGVAPGGTLGPAAQARIDDLDRLGATAFAALRAPRLVWRPEANPGLVAAVADGMGRVDRRGYGQAVRMLASGRLLDDAARLSVPTDVIVGAEDVVTPPGNARDVHAAVRPDRRGALTIVPEAGHALYHQAPAAFARALTALTEAAR